jgi:hypothetical protein
MSPDKQDIILQTLEHLSRCMGARLNRDEMCARLRTCRQTLSSRIKNGSVPKPLPDGKWLLADVMVWEVQYAKITQK